MNNEEKPTQHQWQKTPLLLLLLPLVSYILLAYYLNLPLWNDPGAPSNSPMSGRTNYLLRITDYPVEKTKSIQYNASLLYRQDSACNWQPIDAAIRLTLQKDSLATTLRPGDIIVAKTTIQQPHAKNPDEFDYMNYLRLVGYSGTAFVAKDSWAQVGYKKPRGIRACAIFCRNYLYQRYRACGLTGAELGVVSALTLGYTEDLDPETRQTFTAAGAAHILAVSGMHTAIIFLVLWSLLTGFGHWNILYHERKRRLVTISIILFLLWFYGFLTGLTPSVLRSVLMISLYLYGKMRYFPSNTYNILFAAAFIELLFYPLHLFTASFLLSYFAVFAILYLQPRFTAFYTAKTNVGTWLWESLTVSFAAQIGTFPLTCYLFGQASNYFVITNIVVLLISYVVMLLAVPALVLQSIPVIGTACSWLLNQSTHLMIQSSQWIESLPYSLTRLQLTMPMFLLLCVAIITTCLFFRKERWYWLATSMACLILMLGSYTYTLHQESQPEELIVFAAPNQTTLLHRNGRNTTLFTNDSTAAMNTTETYRRKHYLAPPTLVHLPDSGAFSFTFAGQECLLIDNPILEDNTLKEEVTTDILLLGNIGRISAKRLLTLLDAKQIVALPTLSYYKTQTLQYLLPDSTLFHDCHEQAFTLLRD